MQKMTAARPAFALVHASGDAGFVRARRFSVT